MGTERRSRAAGRQRAFGRARGRRQRHGRGVWGSPAAGPWRVTAVLAEDGRASGRGVCRVGALVRDQRPLQCSLPRRSLSGAPCSRHLGASPGRRPRSAAWPAGCVAPGEAPGAPRGADAAPCFQLAPDDAWRCPHCKQLQQGSITLSLWTLPDVLIVHLKRFRQVRAPRASRAPAPVWGAPPRPFPSRARAPWPPESWPPQFAGPRSPLREARFRLANVVLECWRTCLGLRKGRAAFRGQVG